MADVFARLAMLSEGWQHDVRISINDGFISDVARHSKAQPGDSSVDTLLPAMPNLHSHTFQRAMAGMTEQRSQNADSFWTWRDLMYRFVQYLTPEDVEAIAGFAFMEMQERGFGSCAEFHYIHHAAGGQPYANISELAERVMSAANATGIGLTLLPVLYSYAGLSQRPLAENQLRFKNTLEKFLKLRESTEKSLRRNLPADACIGVAPHSLRATSGEDLNRLSSLFRDQPFHIHVAEHEADENDSLQRPVEWLLNNCQVDPHWCLIHATHMTLAEVSHMAKSGAVAGLCPVTEANLGDGIFEAKNFIGKGGTFGIGTDSNINISVTSELEMLEYSQRLRDRERNVLSGGPGSTGTSLFKKALAGGSQALGRNCGSIAEGQLADLVAINASNTQLMALNTNQLLDGWIFASSRNLVTDLWSAGRHNVSQGRHIKREPIETAYRKTLNRLAALL
ncbi:MAG: formimidoylglutamate deiminase [Aestuariivirga sp.]